MNYPYNYNYNIPTSSSSSMVGNCGAKEKKNKGSGKRNTGGTKTTSYVRLSTDPQSVAARERRHRISDRFKILQSMVPGGTKMDTVSMLDEAIHYVKFLKTQIWLHETMINSVDDDPAAVAADAGLFFPSSGNSSALSCQEMSGYTADYQDLVTVAEPPPPLLPPFQDFGFQCDEIMQYNACMKN